MTPPETPRSNSFGVLCALFCVLVWAVNYPAMKVAFLEIEPLAYTGWRFLISSAIVVSWALANGQAIVPPPGTRKLALILSLSGIGVYQGFYSLGVAKTSGFSAALLNTVSPLLALLFVALFGWEKLTPLAVVGSLVAYGGVALFIFSAHSAGLGALTGNLLCLGSAASWALYSVMASRIKGRMDAATAQVSTFLFGTVVLLPYCLPSMLRQDYTRIHALSGTIIVLSAVLPLVIAFRAWTVAIRILGVQQTTSFSFLIPIVAGITSAAWTGERFTVAKIGAAMLVFVGMALTRMQRT